MRATILSAYGREHVALKANWLKLVIVSHHQLTVFDPKGYSTFFSNSGIMECKELTTVAWSILWMWINHWMHHTIKVRTFINFGLVTHYYLYSAHHAQRSSLFFCFFERVKSCAPALHSIRLYKKNVWWRFSDPMSACGYTLHTVRTVHWLQWWNCGTR